MPRRVGGCLKAKEKEIKDLYMRLDYWFFDKEEELWLILPP